MGTSTLISIWLGMWLGIRAGWHPGSVLDRSASAVSLALWSVPTFWLGLILLVVFGSGSVGGIPAIFPAGGMQTHGTAGGLAPSHITDVAWHLVLPCLTLVAVIFAQYVTIMRSSIIDERGNPYLLTARAKGLRDEVVRRRHAVPNALLPSVTVIFLQIGGHDRRRDHRRGRLLVAGPGLPDLHRPAHPRPPAARGHVHRLQCGRHRLQPASPTCSTARSTRG